MSVFDVIRRASSVSDAIRRTKINPYMLLLLLAGAAAVAYVALGASLFRQHQKQDELSSQIDSAEAVLATSGDVRQDLEDLPARLVEAKQELATAQAAFPSELDSNNILKTVLYLAHQTEVQVISVNTAPPAVDAAPPTAEPTEEPTQEPTEDMSNSETLTFDVQVAGDLGQLLAFLGALEQGATSTTRVSTFTLQGAPDADGWYLLDIELIAFARSTTSEASSPDEGSTPAEKAEAISDGEETPAQ